LAFASRHSLGFLIGLCAVSAVVYELQCLLFHPQYTIGDWLINYSQGFVRRGFFGQIILFFAHLAHLPPSIMTVIVQLTIYAAFLRGVYLLAAPLRRDPLWYALLFSPATLAFMVIDMGSGCRKELLLHAALVATILLVLRKTPELVLSLCITALFVVLVLSHETLACCFPYFFAAVAIGARNIRSPLRVLAVPCLVAAVLENTVRHHLGTMAVSLGICRSVGGRWVGANDSSNLCAGAIGHLSWTVDMYRQEELNNLHYWPLYAFLALLALAPLVTALLVLYRRDRLRFDVKVIAAMALLSAIASAPLFYLAIDWGRWIYMQTLCLLLVILMAAQHAPGFLKTSTAPPLGQGKPWRKPLLAAVFLYCTVWTLPVIGMSSQRFGYLGIPPLSRSEFRYLRHQQRWSDVDRGF
jgi:hypothetical protein